LEVGGWRLEVGGWRLEVEGWRLEVGGWKVGRFGREAREAPPPRLRRPERVREMWKEERRKGKKFVEGWHY
jgi:hypothetical protein